MNVLDDIVREIANEDDPLTSLDEASAFLRGLRKLAEGPQSLEPAPKVSKPKPEPKPEPKPKAKAPAKAKPAPAPEPEAEPLPEEVEDAAAAPAEELGSFLAPTDAVLTIMNQLVSLELQMAIHYKFYAQMVRGAGRGAIASLFETLAKDELKDASYLMRRISILSPGGSSFPPPVPPEPTSDQDVILNKMIVGEQQAIVALKSLRQQLGEDPMRYTVEQMIADEQAHMDQLQQFLPQTPLAKEASHLTAAIKISEKRRQLSAISDGGTLPTKEDGPPIGDHLAGEQEQALAQSEGEKAFLAQRLQQAEGLANQAMASQQMLQNQVMEAQTAATGAQSQAGQAMQMATMAEQNAAEQANAKMRLNMRIQQLRQTLADIASSDPAQEEGLGFGQQAGPGVPGAQQPVDPAVSQQEALAQEQQLAQTDPQAAKEVSQARRAQGEAVEQTQEAQAAQQKPPAKKAPAKDPKAGGGMTVQVKTSARGHGATKLAVSVKWIKDIVHKASKGRVPTARFAESAEKHWGAIRESERNAVSNRFGASRKVLSPDQAAKREAAFGAAHRVADNADIAAMKIKSKTAAVRTKLDLTKKAHELRKLIGGHHA